MKICRRALIMFRRCSTFPMFALLVTACAWGESGKRALVHQRVGESYLSEKNYSGALEELLKAVQLNPNDADIHFDLGVAYQGKGRLGEAIEHFKRAIEIKPDFSEARNRLGVVYSTLGRYDSAIQEFQTALQNVLYPTPEMIYQNLSYTYYLMRDCERANGSALTGLRFRPDHPVLLNSYGLSLTCLKKFKEAEEAFRQALKASPAYVEAHLSLGDLLVTMGRVEEARRSFEEVIRLSPFGDYTRLARSKLELLK